MDIRDVIKRYMTERCIKPSLVAHKANLTPAQFSNILSKRRRLDANELVAVCNAMSVTPDELLDLKKHPIPA